MFPGFWRVAAKHWRMGKMRLRDRRARQRLWRSLQKLVPDVRAEDLVAGGSGVRARGDSPVGCAGG